MPYDKRISEPLSDNNVDDHVDKEIEDCLSLDAPKNFFMFAGAGSGKTRSLVNALSFLERNYGKWLTMTGKRIAVITYTNAACDEIQRRLNYKSVFFISTIHSFLWELIKDFQVDIKEWIVQSLKEEISSLRSKQTKGRGGKMAEKKAKEIEQKSVVLSKINEVKRFSYNPNGENTGYNTLSHSDVIKMGSYFIQTEQTMQDILIGKYPILLIDECQDTKRELVDALLTVCNKHTGTFTVGMFGDTMQRIYTDGKDNLQKCIPQDWEKPQKLMNHRSAKRIVDLANAIRKPVDGKLQKARSDAQEGFIRLFIVSSNSSKEVVEAKIEDMMVDYSGDSDWHDAQKRKCLILEHHMAASRFGFSDLFEPLNDSGLFSTALHDGSIPELSFLANVISPMIKAYQDNDYYTVSGIVRQHSPLLDKKLLRLAATKQAKLLEKADTGVRTLASLWDGGQIPPCLDVLKVIRSTGLFTLGPRVDEILSEPIEGEDGKIASLRSALAVRFDVLERYAEYISDSTQFATHQGVKGLEFPHVMVIVDDASAKGFLFSYEKLFGAKELSDTDRKNESEGKDTSVKRTARLFYVACTRAIKSLAVVVYCDCSDLVKKTAVRNGWFSEDEIVIL